MKIVKRLLLLFFVLLVLLVGAAVAIPYFFKDELLTLLKEEINKNVLAKVDFADVDLSLLRSFPDFSLQIKDYAVEGINELDSPFNFWKSKKIGWLATNQILICQKKISSHDVIKKDHDYYL